MEHMFWKGPTGSELYCDLNITTPTGRKIWSDAIEAAKSERPFIAQPLFVRTVLVDFGELAMRRMALTLDPNAAMEKSGLDRLIENEERLRKRIATF